MGAEICLCSEGPFREAQNNGMQVLPSVCLFQFDHPFKKTLILTWASAHTTLAFEVGNEHCIIIITKLDLSILSFLYVHWLVDALYTEYLQRISNRRTVF